MGEEEKKPEETKVEEKKPEEPPKKEEKKKETEKPPTEEEKKPEESKEVTPPEIVLKVFMHCEGCARKVRRSLKGFPGVEDVVTDCKSHKVVVKGEKADPLKVLERVQRKSHRQVELLSPIPKPPSEQEKKIEEKEKPKPQEEKKAEEPKVMIVILKVHMHCEACSQEIKRRIEKIKGVVSAEPDLKNSLVTVKGVLETDKLVEYVYKRTGKQAVIVKQEPEKKEHPKETKDEEKKTEEGEKDQKGSGEGEEKKEAAAAAAEGDGKPSGDGGGGAEEVKVVELKRNEYYFNPPRYGTEFYAYPGPAYPPQIFSDENPNACSIM